MSSWNKPLWVTDRQTHTLSVHAVRPAALDAVHQCPLLGQLKQGGRTFHACSTDSQGVAV